MFQQTRDSAFKCIEEVDGKNQERKTIWSLSRKMALSYDSTFYSQSETEAKSLYLEMAKAVSVRPCSQD